MQQLISTHANCLELRQGDEILYSVKAKSLRTAKLTQNYATTATPQTSI